MGVEEIIALMRARSAELVARGNQTVNNLGTVTEANETAEQRRLRNAAQCDWNAARELDELIERIESRRAVNPT